MKIFAENALVENRIYRNISLELQENIIVNIREKARRNQEELYIEKNDLLVPGFVNAHTHLELSHLKNKIPQGKGMLAFLENVVKYRKNASRLSEILSKEITNAHTKATAFFIDIANETDTLSCKQKIAAYTCLEAIGFAGDEDERMQNILKKKQTFEEAGLPVEISPHAPYSVSLKMWRLLRKNWNEKTPEIISLHLLESEEERELMEKNKGDFRKFFNKEKLTNSDNILENLQQNLPSFENTVYLFVHLRIAEEHELETLQKIYPNAYFVLCPRSNHFITNKIPDLKKFKKYFSRLLLGTDSLASNYDLNVWNEVKFLARHFSLSVENALQFTILNPRKFLKLPIIRRNDAPSLTVIKNYRNLQESKAISLQEYCKS